MRRQGVHPRRQGVHPRAPSERRGHRLPRESPPPPSRPQWQISAVFLLHPRVSSGTCGLRDRVLLHPREKGYLPTINSTIGSIANSFIRAAGMAVEAAGSRRQDLDTFPHNGGRRLPYRGETASRDSAIGAGQAVAGGRQLRPDPGPNMHCPPPNSSSKTSSCQPMPL